MSLNQILPITEKNARLYLTNLVEQLIGPTHPVLGLPIDRYRYDASVSPVDPKSSRECGRMGKMRDA